MRSATTFCWVFLAVFVVGALGQATPAAASPFTLIRIGDVDGFGYGTGAGFTAANGGPANLDGAGLLTAVGGPGSGTPGDFLPDNNLDGATEQGRADDFDFRTAAELNGDYLEGSGFTDTASTGSDFTDVSMSTSYSISRSQTMVKNVPEPGTHEERPDTYCEGNDLPIPNYSTPHGGIPFVFDFFVADGDIEEGGTLSFKMLFGDYDVPPGNVRLTYSDESTDILAITSQTNTAGEDGLIQMATASPGFYEVFDSVTGGYDGYLKTEFIAQSEPYLGFDYVEISTTAPIPEPTTMALLALGILAWAAGKRLSVVSPQ